MKRKLFISLISIYAILFISAIIFFTAWRIDLKRHDNLSEKYGHEFESYYVHNNNSKIKFLSVLDYSSSYARVHYLFENDDKYKIIEFVKINGNWEIKNP